MPFAHASCIVTRAETRERGAWLREFWLTPEHDDWVEVGYDRPEGPRTRPNATRRALVFRGKVGELLAQEFLDDFPEPEALLALQREVDALRAGEDETRWSAERRAAIERAQRALEDAVYAARPPLHVTLVLLDRAWADRLRSDLTALALPNGHVVDASG